MPFEKQLKLIVHLFGNGSLSAFISGLDKCVKRKKEKKKRKKEGGGSSEDRNTASDRAHKSLDT